MASALYLYFDGLSLRKVQRYLKRRYGAKVSFRTILGWIEKYVPTVEKFTDSITPNLSGVWHSDETVLKFQHGTPCPVKANGKKERRKGSQHWFWDCIDEGTRYLVSCHLSKTRSLEAGTQHFKNCKAVGGRPKVIITDKLLGHGRFIRKALWNPNKDKMVTHIPTEAIPRHGEEAHNQMIERFHGTLDDRVKPMRGLKSPDTAIPRGFRIHYNFFKPHEGIDYITPAEAAGIHLPFNDGWGNLMTWATYYQAMNNTKDN
ncbi:MAG: DDE-type integrase/transposase/recombinase [Euryarchaeota archaeon]|nr:DDE-type integrase/transposase/recombinase [Euryarchaeota archaeon]